MNFEEIVHRLVEKKKTVSTMESCTGGLLASSITNIEGSSEVFAYGAVTYSNDFKIKMGVPAEIIEKYTVYSKETARAMAKAISNFTCADYGIGITGRLNKEDLHNIEGNSTLIYICIYDREEDTYIDQSMSIMPDARDNMKEQVIKLVCIIFGNHIKK